MNNGYTYSNKSGESRNQANARWTKAAHNEKKYLWCAGFLSVMQVIAVWVFSVFLSNGYSQVSAARYEIDAKRIGVEPTSKDALPRSREFIRLDSTYYVGWMYEGIYKYDRSADFIGYQNAIPALRKAFDLINQDYRLQFRTIFNSVESYSANIKRFSDLFMITNALNECYDNIERPDLLMSVLDLIEAYRFPKDFFGVYYRKAWTFHRNRFFTSAKFPFLQNTVDDNEQAAFGWCYKGLQNIQDNKYRNDALFGTDQAERDKLSIYHYLAILYAYNKKYDSSEYCYKQLDAYGAASYNNWAGLKNETGHFAEAIEDFQRAQFESGGSNSLREPFYYLPMLYSMGNQPKAAIQMAESIITDRPAAPGFGWYNLALARAFLYNGQLDSCRYALDKAAGFREVHIGTTLSQTQYNFTIHLLKYQLLQKQIDAEKFANKGWWYSPSSLFRVIRLSIQRNMAQYALVNEMMYNPERTRLVYDLFCSESTTTFDESYHLIKDFSAQYFSGLYARYQQQDSRKQLQHYFKLFTGLFQLKDGDTEEAQKTFESITAQNRLDTAHEKIFLARLYEGLAKAYEENGDEQKASFYKTSLVSVYPQLVPYSGLKCTMQLNIQADETDAVIRKVTKDIRKARVEWTDAASSGSANGSARVSIIKKGNRYEATLRAYAANGRAIAEDTKMVFADAAGVGNELVLRLFGKGGGIVYTQPAGS